MQNRPGEGTSRGPEAEAAAKVEELQTQLDTAKANAKSKLDLPARPRTPPRRPRPNRPTPPRRQARRSSRLEPVSVYISRATQKLTFGATPQAAAGRGRAVRCDIEVPITIRNPDKPIGTHVLTAVARTDAGLRWTGSRSTPGDDAKAALDRITLPQDVLDRIAPTAWPRSSLIISDEPLHKETTIAQSSLLR